MKKIKIKIPNWAIIIAILVLAVGLTSTFVRASGRFNLPLSWILTPSGTSIDTDNDGLIDFDRLPSGMIIMFDTNCPSSWTRLSALDGKFLVGGATYNTAVGGSDSITLAEANLPSHTHSVDPPSTASGSQSASHTHGMTHTHAVDPPSTGTSDPGNHTHTYVTPRQGRWSADGSAQYNPGNNTVNTSSAGAHSHTVDIGSFTSGGSSAGSTGSQSASHTHTTDIGSFTSGATGSGTSFDNRPAYATIIICKKD